MGCCRCSAACKKWTTFGVAATFLTLGLILAIFWNLIILKILNYEFSISSPNTKGYGMWKETPIPMYLSFYFFNWTNVDEVSKNSSVKPHFKECGPYTYHEHHIRDNVTFYDNSTVSFYNRRIWKYSPEKSVGHLSDKITTINPVLATLSHLVKDKNYIVKIAVNFILEEKRVPFAVTKTVDEFLFTGYDDPMLDLLQKINITGFNIPFTKFGWFVDRNNSAPYDGLWNMNDGADGIDNLGIVENWNYQSQVPYYEGDCGKVQGTQGELWYPPHEQPSIKIFSSDLCSTILLEKDDQYTVHGIQGNKYSGSDKTFDNGTKYLEMNCYLGKGFTGVQYTGVRNVSLCKYGAPALVSFPHFYLADPYYLESVDGLKPNKSKHEMYLAIEPEMGLPLVVQAQIQLNLQLNQVDHIKLLSNVVTRLMPIFWFSQTAELSSDLADSLKTVLMLPAIGQYTGYGFLVLGALIAVFGVVITYKKGWQDSEEEQLLTESDFTN